MTEHDALLDALSRAEAEFSRARRWHARCAVARHDGRLAAQAVRRAARAVRRAREAEICEWQRVTCLPARGGQRLRLGRSA